MARKKIRKLKSCMGMLSIVSLLALLVHGGVSLSLVSLASSFLLLFFILRYGWNWAVVYVLVLFTTICIIWYVRKMDMLALLSSVSAERWKEIGLCLFLSVLSGVLLQKQETEEKVLYKKQTHESEKMRRTLMEQEKKSKELEIELQKAETLRQLDVIVLQDEPERMINECVQLLRQFHIDEIGVYQLDFSNQSLRMKIRVGSKDLVRQTVFLEEARAFYNRLLDQKSVVFRRDGEEITAPVVAVPIILGGEIEQLLIIRHIRQYLSAGYSLEFLQWLVATIQQHYEQSIQQKRAKNTKDDLYANTRIYRIEPFRLLVNFEKEREELFQQPFTCIGMYIRGLNRYTLPPLGAILLQYLREPNKIACNEHTQMLYILLPGTEKQAAILIRKRVEVLLREQKLTLIDSAMFQSSIVV